MKIKSILLSSLFFVLLMGCSVQSKELDQPLNHAEKETTVAWKDTLDEGIFDELDRQKVLSELYKENMKRTALVDQEELEIKVEVINQDETTVEETEVTTSKTETITQPKGTERTNAPVQSKTETVQAKPKQNLSKPKESVKPQPNPPVESPKPTVPAKPEKPKEPVLLSGYIGNTGRIWDNGQEANEWGAAEVSKVLMEADAVTGPGVGRWILISLFYSDGSEKFSIDLEFD